jgi:hypothetical protein
MATEVITTDDLREFKIELLSDIEKLIKTYVGEPTKKWLKSYEVRKLLNISPVTLQNMRMNRTIPFTKIDGTIYYALEDIYQMI